MYPISETAKAMYDRNYRQVILIRMDTEEDTYTLTENDIIAGSFSIDRYSITGNRIEIGTACAGECKFKIKNYDNRWDGVRFEGAQLFVRIGIADWTVPGAESNVIWMPCGYFTVDKPVKNASILSIEALDRMAKLDKPVDWSMFTGSFNPRTLISRICDLCDVIVYDGASLTRLPNANYVVSLPTDTDITYRNLLQSACMLLGACAFFNENGLLAIKWYNTTNVTIDETKRYSHTIQENNITITGIVYVDTLGEEDVEYLSGTKDYAIDISDNPLVGSNIQSVVDALGNALNGFTYRPYSASIKPSPYLYPTDIITFVKNNVSYVGIVSNVTYGINSTTSIEGRGETEEDNGYATYGNFTNVQSKIIEYANKKIDREVTDRTMLLMNLNEMIMNSLGLYETTLQPVPGGGWQYYFHDAPSIGDSTIIYTFGANGFAWTDDWNDGNPVWKYGITRDGNAIVNMLSAYKISADIITAGTMRAVNLIFGTDPNTTELRTNDESTGALFEGSGVMQFETKGEFWAKNIDSNNYIANQIRMRSDVVGSSDTYNRISFYNTKNNIMANQFYADAADNRNEFWFYNNRPGAAVNANNHYMGATSSAYINRLYNYKFNSLSSGGGTIVANNLRLESYANYNWCTFDNRNESGGEAGYLSFRSQWTSGDTYNGLWLNNYNLNSTLANGVFMSSNSSVNWFQITNNRSVSSASESPVHANNIILNEDSDDYDLNLNNFNFGVKSSSGGALAANKVLLSSTSGNNEIYIRNLNVGGTYYQNQFSLTHNKSTLRNDSWITNYNNSGSPMNSIGMCHIPANDNNQVDLNNYHINGNMANSMFMSSTNNASYLSITNRKTDGTVRTGIYMNSDGNFEITTNTGGNHRITMNKNGNLDVVGNNVVYLGQERGNGYLSLATKNYRGDVYWTQVSNIQNSQYVLVADGVVYEGKS